MMHICSVILLLTLISIAQAKEIFDIIPLKTPQDEKLYKEAVLEETEFINFYGYPAENHIVTTEDGFILTLHRIPNGKQKSENGKRKPVLIMHGVLAQSSLFTDSGKPSLGFYLADIGYDVWLGNMRGNLYTRHKKYSRKSEKFWDFSWQEMAEIDVPRMIDYILKETGFEKLTYMAYSMGTVVGFALFSSKPEYHKKVTGFVALSPIASFVYAPTLPRVFAQYKDMIKTILGILGIYSFPSLNRSFYRVEALFCPESNPTLCSLGINLSGGYSENVRNSSRDFLYVNHASAGASVKTLLHLAQMVLKPSLREYDYGAFTNGLKYHQATPPEYLLNKIKIPVVIFHSANDALSDPLDVEILSRSLPNLIGKELVGPATMNHLDMIHAVDAKTIYYDKLVPYLQKL